MTSTLETEADKPSESNAQAQSEAPFQFYPSDNSSPHVPTNVVGADMLESTIHLPIIVEGLEGTTYEISLKGRISNDDQAFWEILKEQVKKWSGDIKEDNFGNISDEERDLLKTGSVVLPGLIGLDGGLVYDHLLKGDKINKGNYKAYLSMAAENISHLQAYSKDELADADQKNPMTRNKVASRPACRQLARRRPAWWRPACRQLACGRPACRAWRRATPFTSRSVS